MYTEFEMDWNVLGQSGFHLATLSSTTPSKQRRRRINVTRVVRMADNKGIIDMIATIYVGSI